MWCQVELKNDLYYIAQQTKKSNLIWTAEVFKVFKAYVFQTNLPSLGLAVEVGCIDCLATINTIANLWNKHQLQKMFR